MGWDYVSELRPPKGLFFIPQIMTKEELRWNYTDRGKLNNSEKNLSSATLSTKKQTWIDKGANRDLSDDTPMTNCLNHGKALQLRQSVNSLVNWLFDLKSAVQVA
jgi:hypothetical protein